MLEKINFYGTTQNINPTYEYVALEKLRVELFFHLSCSCHPGWTGENCDVCIPLPECKYGFCERPMECICQEGFEGNFCEQAICSEVRSANSPKNKVPALTNVIFTHFIFPQGCNRVTGFCSEPNECWCRPGYQGPTCDECTTYPGCVNGFCDRPFQCICQPGFTGKLCDRPAPRNLIAASKLTFFWGHFSSNIFSDCLSLRYILL